MTVKVFFSSVSGSREMRANQEKIFNTLDSKKIQYESVDISQNGADKDLMRQLIGDKAALPPQIFNGDIYCGDTKAFEHAIEMEELEKFLKL